MTVVTAERDPEGAAVGIVRFSAGERNHLTTDLLQGIIDAYTEMQESGCSALVLTTDSKHFSAGAEFSGDDPGRERSRRASAPIYDLVPSLFDRRIPVIAVVDGAAIGAGLGLALSAEYRVAGPRVKFSANFARIGLSPGFALTHTLPRVVGRREAASMFYTGRRIGSEEALEKGLCDILADTRRAAEDQALDWARDMAASAPQSIRAIHAQLYPDAVERVREALVVEHEYQRVLYDTDDFREGVTAARERRVPRFTGA